MTPTWEIPMGQPPQVLAIGRNAHGFVPSDRYRLPDLWSLHLYSYDALLKLDGQEVTVRPGMLGITPPGTMMETRYYGISVHIYAHFKVPAGSMRPVAALTDLNGAYEAVYQDLYSAVVRFSREPVLASATVWNALWKAVTLFGTSPEEQRVTHRAVRIATDTIEGHLDGRISVTDLAHKVDVTPSYLTRLFQETYGESVVGFIRRRRMERASDLLQRSNLPIKMVASSVGFTDLQQFNKAVRGHFGMSPRAWRLQGAKQAETSRNDILATSERSG